MWQLAHAEEKVTMGKGYETQCHISGHLAIVLSLSNETNKTASFGLRAKKYLHHTDLGQLSFLSLQFFTFVFFKLQIILDSLHQILLICS